MNPIKYTDVDTLRHDLHNEVDLLLLDCRSNEAYRAGHICKSANIVLPQLIMKRLKTSKLPLKSLVPPNFRQEKEEFLKKCLTYKVVLYDHDTTEVNFNNPTLLGLLTNRMLEERCAVSVLKGGYTVFETRHPGYCSRHGLGSCPQRNNNSNPVCKENVTPHEERCSPSSTPSYGPPILGLETLTISSGGNEVARARFEAPTSGFHDIHHRHDRFNSEGESEDPNSAASVTSSDCIDRAAAKNISLHSSISSSLSQRPENYPFAPSTMSSGPVEILQGLYLGCAKDAADKSTLKHCNITYILNVTPNLPNVFEDDVTYKYKQIAITDHWSQNLSQFFPEAISFIDEARSKKCGILVHCLAGISRSVTVMVAYLMQKNRWSLNDAYDFVKQRKDNVSPNFNFMGQLLDFEKTLGIVNGPCEDNSLYLRNDEGSTRLFFTSPPPPTPKLTLPIKKKEAELDKRTALILTNAVS